MTKQTFTHWYVVHLFFLVLAHSIANYLFHPPTQWSVHIVGLLFGGALILTSIAYEEKIPLYANIENFVRKVLH